ncbi:MAG: hypothetical protein ACI9FJ_002841, partial [Alteromonadaceae bacterium]
AWDNNYPSGVQLFAIEDFKAQQDNYNFFKFAHDLAIVEPLEHSDSYNEQCYQYFKEIKFHLDIYKRYPSLMPNYVDPTTISALEDEMKLFIKQRFEDVVDKDELNLTVKIDNAFTQFFDKLFDATADTTFITTNYDFIIEKIIHNTSANVSLNRGVIDKKQFADKSWQNDKVNVFKLNGGFEISQDHNGSYIDYNHNSHTPNIILPSQEQNYNEPYFDNIFIKSAAKLRGADLLVFIGYSFPEEDHTIRFLLKNFSDSHNKNKEIVIIGRNIGSATATKANACKLFPYLADKEAIYAFDGELNDLLIQGVNSKLIK